MPNLPGTPRYNWPQTFKSFINDTLSDPVNFEAVLVNKDSFVDKCKERFPGTKLTKQLLNYYIYAFRKGKLASKRVGQQQNTERAAFLSSRLLEIFKKA